MLPPQRNLVLDMIATCRAGWRFYLEAAQVIENSELRCQYREMAEVHLRACEELCERQLLDADAGSPSPWFGFSRVNYGKLPNNAQRRRRHILSAQRREKIVLRELRRRIKLAHSPMLAREMAHQLAAIQVSQDKLDFLHRYSQHPP